MSRRNSYLDHCFTWQIITSPILIIIAQYKVEGLIFHRRLADERLDNFRYIADRFRLIDVIEDRFHSICFNRISISDNIGIFCSCLQFGQWCSRLNDSITRIFYSDRQNPGLRIICNTVSISVFHSLRNRKGIDTSLREADIGEHLGYVIRSCRCNLDINLFRRELLILSCRTVKYLRAILYIDRFGSRFDGIRSGGKCQIEVECLWFDDVSKVNRQNLFNFRLVIIRLDIVGVTELSSIGLGRWCIGITHY